MDNRFPRMYKNSLFAKWEVKLIDKYLPFDKASLTRAIVEFGSLTEVFGRDFVNLAMGSSGLASYFDINFSYRFLAIVDS